MNRSTRFPAVPTLPTIAAIAVAPLLLVALAGCSGADDGKGAESPKDAVETVLTAGIKGDFDTVCALTLTSEGAPMDADETRSCKEVGEKGHEAAAEQLKQMEDAPSLTEKQEEEIKQFIDSEPTISDEKDGVVTVTYDFAGTPIPITTKKIDGGWFVLPS